MRTELKHIHIVNKKLADGSVKKFYYHRKTRLPIKGQPGSAEFLRSYHEAGQKTFLLDETFEGLVIAYKASPEFENLSVNTRDAYRRALDKAVEQLGGAPWIVMEDERFKSDLIDLRNLYKDTPSVADKMMAAVSSMLSWAVQHKKLSVNQAIDVGKLYKGGKRNHIVWSEDHMRAFEDANPDYMVRAMWFAYYTMQRQSDLLQLSRTQFRNNAFHLMQEKTDKIVEVPVHPKLLPLIKNTPMDRLLFLVNSRGQPWTTDGFKTSWRKAMKRAGLERSGLHFHDLRGTGISDMIAAGVPTAIAAEIAGMTIETAEKYISVNSKARKDAMAAWANAQK